MARSDHFKLKGSGSYYLLLLPTYALIATFNVVPFVWAFAVSLYEYEVGSDPAFVGLRNYAEYLKDPTFALGFKNMAFLTLFALVVNIVSPLLIAKLIFSLSSERARYIYRVLFLIPVVVPAFATVLIWKGVYGEQGLINEFLRFLGMSHLVNAWLSNPSTVLLAIAFIGFPFANGINILIFYAGLTSIPDSVHEAAIMDGATGIRKFLRIDLPLVLSQVKLLVMLTIIGGVQAFDLVFILTRGGPGFESMVPGLWMYFNAFSFQKMGYACAIGVILFLLILVLTGINAKLFKTSEQIQGTR